MSAILAVEAYGSLEIFPAERQIESASPLRAAVTDVLQVLICLWLALLVEDHHTGDILHCTVSIDHI